MTLPDLHHDSWGRATNYYYLQQYIYILVCIARVVHSHTYLLWLVGVFDKSQQCAIFTTITTLYHPLKMKIITDYHYSYMFS